ncbi:MAG TPA: Fe-S cluster assembly protein SufB [Ktedonobacterales bacterium]|jgi:Fe-S cluster assembly scaffold protein SufB
MSELVTTELDKYSAGFSMPENYAFKSKKGLSRAVVEQISEMKGEPAWMRQFRLKSLDLFLKRPMPTWGADLSGIDFDNIYYYIKPMQAQGKTWEEVPAEIKETFDRLGIPEAERKFLAGVTAQYESEAVYHKVREDLEKLGVIFTDMDTALREHPDIVKEYFGTVIPPSDNKFASLNSAVWSGGSFVYVPEGVRVEIPLQAYFRINAQNMGQFERTLIIASPGSYIHYVEGCTAPTYASDSLHSAVVEIIVQRGARVRYTTIQNWSKNVYNLVTKRAAAYADATMEWVDGNLGCLAEGSTVTTPDGVKTIEALEVGEKVLSYDEKTGALCFRTVKGKRFSGHQPVQTVSIGERKLRVTANHPFFSYIEDKQAGKYHLAYVRADHLKQAIVPRLAGVSTHVRQPELVGAAAGRSSATLAQNRQIGRSSIELPETVEIVDVDVSEPTAVEVPTWDIEVEGTGNFVSQGFIVHNSKVTMKYPAVLLMEPGAHGEVLSVAFAGDGMHQDAGAKITHLAPNTTSQILSKSISKGTGRASYRGLVRMNANARHSKSNVRCDALLLDEQARTDTYPTMRIENSQVEIGHEATVSKVGEEQLFYLMSRGLSENEAYSMIVNGFIEPITKELPMEYAVELNRLIQLEMEGSVG